MKKFNALSLLLLASSASLATLPALGPVPGSIGPVPADIYPASANSFSFEGGLTGTDFDAGILLNLNNLINPTFPLIVDGRVGYTHWGVSESAI